MEKLVAAYIGILKANGDASEKFWTLEKRLCKDKRSPGVMIDMRRSRMRDDLLRLLHSGVITAADLADFSQELQDDIALLY